MRLAGLFPMLFTIELALAGYEPPLELAAGYLGDGLRPVALASCDLDEDGTPDLIVGHAGEDGGAVSVHRGNPGAIHPRSVGAREGDLPFLEEAPAIALPRAPELLASGDFDADGHCDLVWTAAGSRSLHLLPGDGRGGFLASEQRVVVGLAAPARLDEDPTVLTMRLNGDARDDFVVLGAGARAPEIVRSVPLATFSVTSTANGGPGSLRQAILDANASPGPDTITFAIPGATPTRSSPRPRSRP